MIRDSDWSIITLSNVESSACLGETGNKFFTSVNQDIPLTHVALANHS